MGQHKQPGKAPAPQSDTENSEALSDLPGSDCTVHFSSDRESYRFNLNLIIILLVVTLISLAVAFVVREAHYYGTVMYSTDPTGIVTRIHNIKIN